ncbi:hypothetical protein BYT27DRAFT_7255582 [Phlegmacium glaucopus]|nr:hypothetical protein BYT27DRAFT_7255582 [Phlegmacium glaucopus]
MAHYHTLTRFDQLVIYSDVFQVLHWGANGIGSPGNKSRNTPAISLTTNISLNLWRLFNCHVLVNSKSDETRPALYKISPAPQNGEVIPTSSIDEAPPLEWDVEYNAQPFQFTPGHNDDESMEPSNNLELDSLPPNPVLEAPLLTLIGTESIPSMVPTPIIDPQLMGLQYRSPLQSSRESAPPDTAGQTPPQPQLHPKGKKTAATTAATDPEQELGHTKCVAKCKLDLYKAEELKAAECAEKKAQDKQEAWVKGQKRK